MAEEIYFAAKGKDKIGEALANKLLHKTVKLSPELEELYANAYSHYYGVDEGQGITTGLTRTGGKGEKVRVRINYARAYAKALLSIVTGPKLNWKTVARNSDSNVEASALLAMNLLDDYWRSRRMNRFTFRWVEQAIFASESFLFNEWDLSQGPPLAPRGDTMLKQGDFTFHNILPWHVRRDQSYRSYEASPWINVTLYKNKWELMRLFPKCTNGEPSREKILASGREEGGSDLNKIFGFTDRESDVVPVHYWFHDSCASLPKGREVVFLSPGCVLRDRINSYSRRPVHRLVADEMFDTTHAWSSFWDALGPQELMDEHQTSIASNQTAMGTQLVAMERGSEIDKSALLKGMRVILVSKNGMVPQGVQLAKSDPQVFPHLATLKSDQRQLMGLNDVALGQPQSAQMNAQAFAVLASMAVQQASPFQTAYVDGVGDLGTSVIGEISTRVKTPRILQVAGRGASNLVSMSQKKYVGADVSAIDKVIVEVGNPMEQTAAGRQTILDYYQKMGVKLEPDQIQQVFDTGRLEPVTERRRNKLLLIKSENEALSRGEVPMVHTFHDHVLHMRENVAPLETVDGMSNKGVADAVAQHWDEHYRELYGLPDGVDVKSDPQFFTRKSLVMDQMPPPDLMPQAVPGAPGPGGPPPGPEQPMPAEATAGAPGPTDETPPTMPDNPITQQPFDLATGGGLVTQ